VKRWSACSIVLLENNPYPQGDYLRTAFGVVQAVSPKEVVEAGFTGSDVREELHRRRITALESWRENQRPA